VQPAEHDDVIVRIQELDRLHTNLAEHVFEHGHQTSKAVVASEQAHVRRCRVGKPFDVGVHAAEGGFQIAGIESRDARSDDLDVLVGN
jgi:hypothetical protein